MRLTYCMTCAERGLTRAKYPVTGPWLSSNTLPISKAADPMVALHFTPLPIYSRDRPGEGLADLRPASARPSGPGIAESGGISTPTGTQHVSCMLTIHHGHDAGKSPWRGSCMRPISVLRAKHARARRNAPLVLESRYIRLSGSDESEARYAQVRTRAAREQAAVKVWYRVSTSASPRPTGKSYHPTVLRRLPKQR
ncbi:hypothetical protein BD413DRAFT_53029 [Trametes elegans]|nr:hypothetical protein BD413DRAFT_53029 [Trametes elegans]